MAAFKTRQHLDPRRVPHCESLKVSYDTYDQAHAAAELGMLRGQVLPGCHLMPYECHQCRRWHVANRIIVPLGPRRGVMFQE